MGHLHGLKREPINTPMHKYEAMAQDSSMIRYLRRITGASLHLMHSGNHHCAPEYRRPRLE